MDRWVGFGVIADNLINIGRVMDQAAEPSQALPTIGFCSPPVTPAGFALPGAIDHNAGNLNCEP
jgi:hypothetical protein